MSLVKHSSFAFMKIINVKVKADKIENTINC